MFFLCLYFDVSFADSSEQCQELFFCAYAVLCDIYGDVKFPGATSKMNKVVWLSTISSPAACVVPFFYFNCEFTQYYLLSANNWMTVSSCVSMTL